VGAHRLEVEAWSIRWRQVAAEEVAEEDVVWRQRVVDDPPHLRHHVRSFGHVPAYLMGSASLVEELINVFDCPTRWQTSHWCKFRFFVGLHFDFFDYVSDTIAQ
jgi:hypothetical protein